MTHINNEWLNYLLKYSLQYSFIHQQPFINRPYLLDKNCICLKEKIDSLAKGNKGAIKYFFVYS